MRALGFFVNGSFPGRELATQRLGLLQPDQAHMQLRSKGAGGVLFVKGQGAASHAHLPMQLSALVQGFDNNVGYAQTA